MRSRSTRVGGGFGPITSKSGSGRAGASGPSGQTPSSQRQLYDAQIAPLIASGLEHKAESLLLLLAQGTNPLPEVFRDLADIFQARGQLQDASVLYQRWLSRLPRSLDQRLKQARKAEQLLMLPLALERYLNVLDLEAHHPEALARATELLMAEGRFVEAMPLLNRRFETEVSNVHLCQLASRCAFETGALDHAAAWAAQALARQPELPVQLAIQASSLQHQGDFPAALLLVETALRLAECTSDWALVNRFVAPILLQQGLFERCDKALAVALSAETERSELHLQRAELLLLQWRLFEGFQEYLWRHERSQVAKYLPTQVIPPGRQLVLTCEGTLGDTLLFSRYAPWLKKTMGMNVSLYVQPPVLRLISHSFGGAISVKAQYQLRHLPSSVDVVPLLSAPALFGTCQEHPELAIPHLQADSDLMAYWRQRLSLQPGERLLGLNWHGSPLHALEERNPSDVPLVMLKPLASLPQIRLLSLQKGVGSEQLEACSFRSSFISIQSEVTAEVRFEHIAALTALCDWVVTDDSGPAHLAGNLGVPTLVLLTHLCNWRWGSSGLQHPWYPRTTLLRQQPGAGWEPLVRQACELISSSSRIQPEPYPNG